MKIEGVPAMPCYMGSTHGTQVLYSSDNAAKFVTGIEGWVDRQGRFWGKDEHMARYAGCTHIGCKDCGKPIPVRGYTICGECRNKKSIEKYNAMPRMAWDGVTPIYSEAADEYFFGEDGLRDHIEEYGCSIESLRLVICEPNCFREIDSDYFCDELPEDGELPDDLTEALNALNEVIRSLPPASWSPGKHAADCDL